MSNVLLETEAGSGIGVIRINRPEARNAFNREVRNLLEEYFTFLADDGDTRCIIIRGSDTVFAAGADLGEFDGCGPIDIYLRNSQRLWQAIASCPKPIIAAVNGYAWGGGCELALHADIVVAGKSASFCQPELKVGLMPGAGATQRLIRAAGKYRAMKMLLTGAPVGAEEALCMGMVSEVVADEDVRARALELAKVIAAMPPVAVAQIKEVMLAGQDAPLETALALERKAFQLLFASEDQKEGVRAFFEKRRPVYKGR